MSFLFQDTLNHQIHTIHEYIKNSGAGQNISALKLFSIFYALMIIENNKSLFNKLFVPYDINIDKIDNIFKFSNLEQKYYDKFIKLLKQNISTNDEDYIKLYNAFQSVFRFSNLVKYAFEPSKYDDEILIKIIDGPILDLFNDKCKNFLFFEIPKIPNANNFYCELVKKISSINNIEQLNGSLYEYFISQDMGIYFTDIYIAKYIYNNLLIPSLNEDLSIKTMIDPFGGSGSFTYGYVDYLINQYKDIDWTLNMNNIYHNDMNEDVVKSAFIEIMCKTGIMPENYTSLHPFKSKFTKKFDYIITRIYPKFNIDNKNKSQYQLNRDKLKKHIESLNDNSDISELLSKQLLDIKKEEINEENDLDKFKFNIKTCSLELQDFCKKYNFEPKNKEECSLILLMNMLNINGTAIIVLIEGIFFDIKYQKIRKILIENFNVTDVISLETNTFKYTSAKTSIIIFHNTSHKTSKINFYDLIINLEDSDKFDINEYGYLDLLKSKGDIKNIDKKFITSALIHEIDSQNYSLNCKKYIKNKYVCNEGYHFEKIGNICQFMKKSKRSASFGKDIGKYNFYSSSDKIKKCDENDYIDNYILIGNGGLSCIHYDNNFSCSSHMFILKSIEINQKFIYFMLSIFFNNLTLQMNGSTIKNLSKEVLINFEIPMPDDPEKIKFWSDCIEKYYDLHINSQNEDAKILYEKLIDDLRKEAICEKTDKSFLIQKEEEEEDNSDIKSVISTSSKASKVSLKLDLPEMTYEPIKGTKESFKEIKDRLNNGNDVKIVCPCNNETIFMTKTWDEHFKNEVHKDFLKQKFQKVKTIIKKK